MHYANFHKFIAKDLIFLWKCCIIEHRKLSKGILMNDSGSNDKEGKRSNENIGTTV